MAQWVLVAQDPLVSQELHTLPTMEDITDLQQHLPRHVEDYLRADYLHPEAVEALGADVAERRFRAVLRRLQLPPSFTCVRYNSLHVSPAEAASLLGSHIQQHGQVCGGEIPVLHHPQVPDILLVPVLETRVQQEHGLPQVVVAVECGNAVLRGAHVYVPGILAAPKTMRAGDRVAVFVDIGGQCRRGTVKPLCGPVLFVGNGVARLSRAQIFLKDGVTSGIGVSMTEPLYFSPSFENLPPSIFFPQNLPCVLAGHVLDVRPGLRVLDMCAAPGGKTTHIATLMGDTGEIIALDKTAAKVQKIQNNASRLNLKSIQTFCCDSTQAIASGPHTCKGHPPFPEEYFDRVLLDAPCSALGKRPCLGISASLRQLQSYAPLQRKLLAAAVALLRPGGVLLYTTCSVASAENERQVAWALRTFPQLHLVAQEPHLGGQGLPGAGLDPQHLRLLQRFDPGSEMEDGVCGVSTTLRAPPNLDRAITDTIGFFMAKFTKLPVSPQSLI
ncbi:tRNA (cytosine(72)-C(5))-methyltransferase NSUN6 isoform X2 [Lampetra planeri]